MLDDLDHYTLVRFIEVSLIALSITGLLLWGFFSVRAYYETQRLEPECQLNPRLLYANPCLSQEDCLERCVESMRRASG